MQSKYLKYFLLLGVAIIWGIILVRVLHSLGDDPSVPQGNLAKAAFKIQDSLKTEPYDLLLDYRDPFLQEDDDVTIDTFSMNTPESRIQKSGKLPIPLSPDISFIRYKGMIINSVTHKKAGIISVNGIDELAKPGLKIKDISVLCMEKKRVQIVYQGEKFWIKQQ